MSETDDDTVFEALVTRAKLGSTGFQVGKTKDGERLATSLGCTIGGYAGSQRVANVNEALAIRIAARRINTYATYVIAVIVEDDGTYFYGQVQTKLAIKSFIAAGWSVLREMRGAHGKYKTLLLGAEVGDTRAELKALDAKYPPTDCRKKARAASKKVG